jgi:hypothetical protein
MENNKTPSDVMLCNEHNSVSNYYDAWTILSLEMIENWPFYCNFEKQADAQLDTIYRNALRALRNIGPFRSRVSLFPDHENKRLVLTKRTWGAIFLDRQIVVSFSHDTRLDNSPYTNLTDWTEIGHTPPFKDEKHFWEDWEHMKNTLVKWSVDEWRTFFKERIKNRATKLEGKAKKLREKASELDTSVSDIRTSLAIL